MTTTTSIPSEILSSIVEELQNSRSSLYSTCLCSRAFYSEAVRVLYRTVVDLDPVSQVAFLETILGRPTLASYLRVYSIPFYAFPARTQILSLFFQGVQNDVFRNLQCLSWNQSLHIHGLSLKLASLVSLRYETIAECDELIPFLSNLSSLKHLAIDSFCLTKGIETVQPLTPSCCPNITTFYTTVFSSTVAFLPGRKIDTLLWDERSEHATNFSDPSQVGHYAARFKAGNVVGDAFARLQRISLRFASWHPLFLDILLGAMGDVTTLEIIFAGSIVTTSVERNMVEGLEQGITTQLCDKPRLHTLIIGWNKGRTGKYILSRLARRILRACPQIERLYAGDGDYGPDRSIDFGTRDWWRWNVSSVNERRVIVADELMRIELCDG